MHSSAARLGGKSMTIGHFVEIRLAPLIVSSSLWYKLGPVIDDLCSTGQSLLSAIKVSLAKDYSPF
jgi:hypothetical protein